MMKIERARKISTLGVQFAVDLEIIRAMSYAVGKPISEEEIRKMENEFDKKVAVLATCPEDGSCLAVWSEEKEQT